MTPDGVTVKPVNRVDSSFPLRVKDKEYVLTQVGLRATLADRKPAPGHEVSIVAKRGWKSNDDGWPDPGGGCRRR